MVVKAERERKRSGDLKSITMMFLEIKMETEQLNFSGKPDLLLNKI